MSEKKVRKEERKKINKNDSCFIQQKLLPKGVEQVLKNKQKISAERNPCT